MSKRITVKRHCLPRDSILGKTEEHIVETKHTEKCVQDHLKWLGVFTDWTNRWPKHCPDCMGHGMVCWTENGAPHGCGYWAMPMQDVCDSCMGEDGSCPRCGHYNGDDEDNIWGDGEENETPCEFCGWNWGKDKDDFCPEGPECYCWEVETDEWEAQVFEMDEISGGKMEVKL